ncbi:MAG: DUF58 domain-containing protein [Anaerolineae bacterium]
MKILERSWIVILLWLTSLILALAVKSPQRDIFFTLTYLFGSLLLFSFLWAWLNLHWTRVTRQTRSRRSQVGKYAEERLIVENTGPLPKLWIELRDYSELPGHLVSRVINSLPAHHRRSWAVKTPCLRRGRFRLGPVTIFSGDPFGLFLLSRQMHLASHIVIYPPAFDLPGFSPRVGYISGGDALRRRTHYVTTNVAGVRDYVPGDSFNRIHWPSTARNNRLIVKEFELDPLADIWLFLDLERRVQVGSVSEVLPDLSLPPLLRVLREDIGHIELEPSTEEYAIAITASLAKHFLDRNRSVGMVTYARRAQREFAQTDRGERQLARILAMLAVARAEGTIPLAQVLAAETIHFTRDTTAVIVTASTDPEWVVAARHLVTRGVRCVAVVIDPASFLDETSTGHYERASQSVVADLVASRIPTYVVRHGDPLEVALNEANVQAA